MQPSTIGLDLAKHIFQVHGIDAAGQVVIRKRLRRSELLAFFKQLPPCLVGIEACGSAHHWARELTGAGPHGAADAAGLREALWCAPKARVTSGGRFHPESCRLIW